MIRALVFFLFLRWDPIADGMRAVLRILLPVLMFLLVMLVWVLVTNSVDVCKPLA